MAGAGGRAVVSVGHSAQPGTAAPGGSAAGDPPGIGRSKGGGWLLRQRTNAPRRRGGNQGYVIQKEVH